MNRGAVGSNIQITELFVKYRV